MTGVEDLLRELAPQVLGPVARWCGDFAAAEDAVQEALLAAALRWPADGVPEQPRAWLIRTARNRVTDEVRSDQARRRREEVVALEVAPEVADTDDSLLLLFLCCHPSLTPPSAIALTLRAVGGLTTAEIARGFLVPEATMAQRISRAKASIARSGVPFALPAEAERADRLRTVLHVLYLVFTEGHTATGGAGLHRVELSAEAIRLTRQVHRLLPAEPEVSGLLALMLLTDARRAARTGPSGELLSLEEQDRRLWDRPRMREGLLLVVEGLRAGSPGDYLLQAAIAGVHAEAARVEDTDWTRVLALYDRLLARGPNPVVSLGRAVAVAYVDGPQAGLAALEGLDEALPGSHRVEAVRGHLLEHAGDTAGALRSYATAAQRATSVPERDYLVLRAARLKGRAAGWDA